MRTFHSLLALGACLTFLGCNCSDAPSGDDDDAGTSDMDGALSNNDGALSDHDGATTTSDATTIEGPGSEHCPEGGCACSNGIDDDGDGLIDGSDPECTGPYDHDEGSFATGIPGDNKDPVWQDCFYDGNSGGGDDDCRYHTECLTGEREATHDSCTLTDDCLAFCQPRTPNGCDCFGCCEITRDDGSTVHVAVGDGCSLDNIEDESACPRCVPHAECGNECGTCELCPGRDESDLPAECYDDPDGGTPTYTCDDGVTCATDADCESTEYCSLGCCLAALI